MMLGPQAAPIIRSTLLLITLTGLFSTAYGFIRYGFLWKDTGGLVIALVMWVAYRLHKNGDVQRSVQVLVWCGTGAVLLLCFVIAGVRTPALLFMPTLCVFAVWLAGLRTGIAVFLVAAATMLGLVAAEAMGYVPPATERTSLAFVLILLPSLAAALLISAGVLQSIHSKFELVMELTRLQEEQLQQLGKSEERFAAMFRANPVPSSTIDGDGTLLDVNQAWVQAFGVTRNEAVGHTYESLGLWRDRVAMAQSISALQTTGSIEGMHIQLRTDRNAATPFLVYVSPVEFGGERRYVVSLLDQTDRVAAEEAQRAQNQVLEARVRERTTELSRTVANLSAAQSELVRTEKLASLGSMVAGISHELNTPIGNTLTVATSLQDLVTRFDAKVKTHQLRRSELVEFTRTSADMSDLIARSTLRAAELISSFKQVAVDVSSQRRREFDLAEVVKDIVITLKPGMRPKDIALRVDIPGPIRCDSLPGAVEQVLTNLVQNAVVHAFEHREQGTITIAAQSDDERVTMTVTDDGAGMSDETLQRAFDPFFTTRLGKGGSGLGLSISHSLAVTALRGNMHAESAPGQGTRVVFSFQQRLD